MKKLAAAFAGWLRRPRRWERRPFFLAAVAACLGIFAADQWGLPALWAWWTLALSVVFSLSFRRSIVPRLLACAAVFALLHQRNDHDPLRERLTHLLAPGGVLPAKLSGLVTDAPEPETTPGSFSFPLRLDTLESGMLPGGFAGRTVYVHLKEAHAAVPRYGDRIQLSGLLLRPRAPRNPGEFDLPAFLHRQSMSAEFEATLTHAELNVREHGAGNFVIAAALHARDWIGAAVTDGITHDPDIAATVRAMALGTREKTPAEVQDAFVASGTMHVFAVSGLHVAMFCAVVFWTLRLTRLDYKWILTVTLLLVFFYVFITGLRPSAWRAALMGAMMLCAPLFDRESRTANTLGAAALLLLSWDTQHLFQPGFSLSFGVILSIAVCYPWCRKAFRRFGEPDMFLPRQLLKRRQRLTCKGLGFVRDSMCLSTASMIGSVPLMIYYFSLVTPIGIVANIFLVLLSEVILIVACVSVLLAGAGLGFLSVLCNKANGLLALVSVKCAQFFAAVPGGHMNFHSGRLWRGDVCEITVLELDHGGASLHLDTPQGRHWLVDTGGLRHFYRSVRPHLTHTPVNRLDGLLLSHTDSYHTGGAPHVRRLFPPREEPRLYSGQELEIEPGVRVRCLFPPPAWNVSTGDDRCAVFLFTCGGVRVLVMNDAGFVTEKFLLAGGEDLRADILIKGRHGGDFSGLPEFINAVRPKAVIFTNDTFPRSESVPGEWKNRIASRGIRLFDQQRTGAVIIRMDAGTTTVAGFYDGSEYRLDR